MARRGHIPIRMCIGCRRRRRKEEMIRFTISVEGDILLSRNEGRGFYICKDPICFNLAKKKNPLDQIPSGNRAFLFQSNENMKGLI